MGKSIAAAKQCTGSLVARQNETVRIYVGNAGPNLISSFHVIGQIFDNVYREGDLLSPPAHSLQKILVPAAGSAVVEFTPRVLGSFLLVDHAILHLHHDGAMALIAIVLIVQMWLLSATLESYLAGHAGLPYPLRYFLAAVFSLPDAELVHRSHRSRSPPSVKGNLPIGKEFERSGEAR